ncbi:TonB-dependent receptor [Sphingomonas sp. EC-HK361]|uniref:TonB-dependent receptor n=1 Tax=Sphingomonas sp. EC-HK361 TaxID=2038397 RepID=UPI0012572A2E|nr:carboxypeptidase regulatory-like domain-containing protein [Sphingomonas sp. EC-HK361]VVS99359.1 TonB-dependent receptor [Sphingomonas sp. EC-HK361]
MRNNLFLGVAVAALVIPAAAMAQDTTSSIRGSVTANGAPVAGAQVTITNVPSGTKSTTTTDATGGFTANGLRAGGPYTVDVTSAQGNTSVTDIYTVVQQSYDLPIELAATEQGGDIVVTASSIKGAGVTSDGPQTVLTQADVRKVASVNRDIRDIERRSPFASLDLTNSRAVSFAGVNPRFNRFTINGVQVGDSFGLNPDASPTGRGPIPFDAIGQVSISIAPYDIRQGGFQGGAIDTVLLSGDNTFHGTGFYSQSRDDIQGKEIGSTTLVLPKYKSETYGATLRGPIIPDKLFFMVSAERNTDPRPFSPSSASGVQNLTDAAVAGVVATANSRYGYNPGTVLAINPNKDEKIVGRIDWNITDGQRLSLSYVNAYDTFTALQNTTASGSSPSLGLESNAYATTELLRAGILQLNSDWTDNLSTEGRFIYRSTKRGQEPLLGRGFAQFGVCLDPTGATTPSGAANTSNNSACSTGTPRVFYGPDISRQTNTLFFDTWAGSLLARYNAGDHEIKLLGEFSENRTSNNFLQYSAGGYYFDSLADYNAGRASQLIYASPLNGQYDGAAAEFKYSQYTFGFQDDWRILDNLTFTYGIRYDLYGMRSTPTLNPYFLSRYGFPNTQTYKGLDNFQPRISFDYKPARNLKLRGGVGVFGGGSPDIYLSNSFSNTILSNRVTISRNGTTDTCTGGVAANICTDALNNVNGKTIPASVQQYAVNNASTLPLSSTGALDQDFRLPSVLKATFSADYRFFGIDFGADYVYTDTLQGLAFTDIRSQRVGTLPDGRPRYNAVTIGQTIGGTRITTDNNYDILLTNTSKGRAHIAVVRFDKTFDWGLSLGGSYTYQNVKDVAAATSSTINSNYANQAMSDPNFPAYGTSSDQAAWQFKYSLGYDHAFFGDYKTTFQLFGETRAGRPYSFTMQDNTTNRSVVFGTLLNNNRYLLYVPTGTTDPIVSYDSTATQTSLETLINNSKLKDYRGTIAAKNIARARAFTRIDLHLEQELPTFIGGSRVSIFGDIENLPNLLNKDWGGVRQASFPGTADAVRVQCLSSAVATGTTPTAAQINTSPTQPCVQYRYSSYVEPREKNIFAAQSLYLIRIGARFTF